MDLGNRMRTDVEDRNEEEANDYRTQDRNARSSHADKVRSPV